MITNLAAEGGGTRDRDALALAAAQGLDRLVDVLDGEEAKLRQLSRARSSAWSALSSLRNHCPSRPFARISRPRNRLSTMERAGESARFWYTVSMPARRASIGERKWIGLPSIRISPLIGRDGARQRLDQRRLPAPLSPMTARISPG